MHLIEALVISALVFIGHNTEYDTGRLLENPPRVVFVKPGEVVETAKGSTDMPPHFRGFYVTGGDAIYVNDANFNLLDPLDTGVIIHETVHWVQDQFPIAEEGWLTCPKRKERMAYRIEEAWLQAQGLDFEMNWLALAGVIECGPWDDPRVMARMLREADGAAGE